MDGEQAVVETPVTVEAAPLPTVEELATELGWKPKDQWEGDESKYRDPAEYIKAGQHGKLVKEVRQLKETTDRMARTAAQTTARALAEQEAELTAKLKKAVAEDDAVEAVNLDRELRNVAAQRQQPDEAVAVFMQANPWYGKDEDATDYAAAVTQRLAVKGVSIPEQLEEAERLTRKRFPELFEDAPRRNAPVVAAPTSRTAAPSKREKGAADLPADAKAAGAEFVEMFKARGKPYTMDDYAKSYWADQA